MRPTNLLLVIGGVFAAFPASADDVTNANRRQSPENVIRAFVTAVSSKNEQAIRRVILPNKNAAVLWQGVSRIRQSLANITGWRECKAGETVALAGKRKLTITDEMVDDNRKMFVAMVGDQLMPPPVPLVLADGEWKVDASFLIARLVDLERGRRVGQLCRACLAYAKDHQGNLPSELSQLQNLPKDMAVEDYELVARGRRSDYKRPGSTVLLKEKRNDAAGKCTVGYLDGHVMLESSAEAEAANDKRVRAVCNVCGAWMESKAGMDVNMDRFAARHLTHCEEGWRGTIVKFLYPSDKRYETLKKEDFEEPDTSN